MASAIGRLKIEKGISELVGKLWKHRYKTTFSCEGHGGESQAYISFNKGTGDGWFEVNAHKYGFRKMSSCLYCDVAGGKNFCGECGAGVNGTTVYRKR